MAIQEKSIRETSDRIRSLFQKANGAAQQKNYPYAFELFRTILRSEPGASDVRFALRKLQLEKVDNKANGLRNIIAAIKTMVPLMIKGPGLLKQEKFSEALDLAERCMETDPTYLGSLRFVAKACEISGLVTVAVQTLELANALHPKNPEVLIPLAAIYEEICDFDKCLKTLQYLAELFPSNTRFINEVNRVSARAAIKNGRWEEVKGSGGSYQDIMINKEQSQELELEGRMGGARDEETLSRLIAKMEKEIAAQPTAANYKKLADLFQRKHDYVKAIETFEMVVKKTGALDPSIDASILECHCAQFDDKIAGIEEEMQKHPERQAEFEQAIDAVHLERNELIFQRSLDRVKRYPNDASYHFELGELYLQRNQLDQALQEFQFSQKSPQYRRKALANMGRCMTEKGIVDLAIEQFNAALEGMDKLDPDRKEFLYLLAQAFDKKGQSDQSLTLYKEIYSLDVNYADVGQRMQALYQQKPE